MQLHYNCIAIAERVRHELPSKFITLDTEKTMSDECTPNGPLAH